MKLKYLIILKILFFSTICFSQTTLTYNNCEFTNNMQQSCSGVFAYYARDFYLSDFGVPQNNNFIINDIDFAITYAEWGAEYQVKIYPIDNNFPNNFDPFTATPIGSSSAWQPLPYTGFGTMPPVEINYTFSTPITIPSGQERILVVIIKGDTQGSGLIHFAGTSIDTGNDWFFACHASPNPNSSIFQNINVIQSANFPGIDWNIYMKVNGSLEDTTSPFTINYNTDCGLDKFFNLNNLTNVQSVIWNFDDLNSGINNVSTLTNPNHLFTGTGFYDISATITSTSGIITNLTQTIQVVNSPIINSIPDLMGCADPSNPNFSDFFDTTNLDNILSGGQSNIVVTYSRQNGDLLPIPLPNNISNLIPNSETITARIAYSNDLCCYSETNFDLVVIDAPIIPSLHNLTSCSSISNGFAQFDFLSLNNIILGSNSQLMIEYSTSTGVLIPMTDWNSFVNINANSDYVTVKITDPTTFCSNDTNVILNVAEPPTINTIPDILACDDDGDGISNDFDVSNVESTVLNNRTGLEVRFFDTNNNDITNSFITPFTNNIAFSEIIRVELTDLNTGCSSYTDLILNTSTQPVIIQPTDLFSCDLGNGFSTFDLSHVEATIISGQSNITVDFFDSNNNQILGSQINNYSNTTAYIENITVLASFNSNPNCFSIVDFNVIVKELPEISLEERYVICESLPSINLSVYDNLDSYIWTNLDNNQVVSNTNSASIFDEGNYRLEIFDYSNNSICSNQYFFNMVRSNVPTIDNIIINNLGDNSLEIIAMGDGVLEYSIDGIDFQNNSFFENLIGGSYTVIVRDIEGCGQDMQIVNILDYPRYFTPNNDGFHDFWQLLGISSDLDAKIFIYDRFGKLLKQLAPQGNGWDGNYNGNPLPSDTYWFEVVLSNKNSFKGYFALKR